MKKGDKIELTFKYTLREIERTNNPCEHCALRAGLFSCFSRRHCKYNQGNSLVYYYDGVKDNSAKIDQDLEQQNKLN